MVKSNVRQKGVLPGRTQHIATENREGESASALMEV